MVTRETKPIKITQIANDDTRLEYELVGKVLDNVLILAGDKNYDLNEEGKDYSLDFNVGKKRKYKASLHVFKQYLDFKVIYIDDLTKAEAAKPYGLTPKEKMMMKELEGKDSEKKKSGKGRK
jgi:hypothetical protein